jgi:hypothetical protein
MWVVLGHALFGPQFPLILNSSVNTAGTRCTLGASLEPKSELHVAAGPEVPTMDID